MRERQRERRGNGGASASSAVFSGRADRRTEEWRWRVRASANSGEGERAAPIFHVGSVGNFNLWCTIIWALIVLDISLRSVLFGLYLC